MRGTDVLIAAAVAGVAVGLADCANIFLSLPANADSYVLQTAVRAALAALAYAVALGAIYGAVGAGWVTAHQSLRAAPGRVPRALALVVHPVVPLLVVLPFVALYLVSGAGISASKLRIPVFIAMLLGGACGLVVAARLARRMLGGQSVGPTRALLPSAFALVAALAYAAGALYPNSYLPAHAYVVLLCVAAAQLAALAFLRGLPRSRGARLWTLGACAIASIASLLVVLAASPAGAGRAMMFSHSRIARHAILLAKDLGLSWTPAGDDLYAALASGEGGDLEERLPVCEGAPRQPLDIILLTVDALRADRLRASGSPRVVLPNIDGMARRGLLFTAAYTPSPATSTSLVPIISGMSPVAIRELGELPPTLASELRDLGYRTVTFTPFTGVSPRVFPGVNAKKLGFDSFENNKLVPEMTRAILGLLADQGKRPFFVYGHVIEPHAPYQGHEEFDLGDRMVDRYDSELSHVDDHIGRIIREIDRLDRWDRTILAISADHGEAFFEHGVMAHGTSLYDEMVRVPLAIVAPGLGPKTIHSPVSLLDLAPTLLSLTGCGWSQPTEGRVLSGAADRDAVPVVAKQYNETEVGRRFVRKVATRVGSVKLIQDLETAVVELYELESDPREERNIASLDEAKVASMRKATLDAERRIGAIIARRASGSAAALARAVRGGSPEAIREAMAVVLSAPGEPGALDLIDALAASPDGRARDALDGLASRTDLPRAVSERIVLARAAGDPTGAAPLLGEILRSDDTSGEHRVRAIELLARDPRASFAEELIAVAGGHAPEDVMVAAATVLCGMDGRAPRAGELLRARFPTAAALGALPTARLNDVIVCLGRSATDADVDLLIAIYSDSRTVRKRDAYQVLRSLGETRKPQAFPFLEDKAKGPYEPVRVEAIEAIAKIEGREALNFLIDEALGHRHLEVNTPGLSSALRRGAQRVIGLVGTGGDPQGGGWTALTAALADARATVAGAGPVRVIMELRVLRGEDRGARWFGLVAGAAATPRLSVGSLSKTVPTPLYLEVKDELRSRFSVRGFEGDEPDIRLVGADLLVFKR